MFPNLLVNMLEKNQSKLYTNRLELVSESTTTVVENGTPKTVTTPASHWSGVGSLQYVRPRIQKSIADENAGTMEDPISIVAYVPFDANPDESMFLVDVDGSLGVPGERYAQSRRPANVGGVGVYWELYLGFGVNA